MSVEARLHIVRWHPQQKLQIHLVTLNAGVLPDRIDVLFRELTKEDTVDFYTDVKSESRGHMTRRYRDCYGHQLRVADLDDIADQVLDQKEWLDYGFLFGDLVRGLKKNTGMKYLVFLEEY